MEPINLSDGEWKLMEALWQNPPKTITQLTKELYEKTQWSKHTIITMLNRLEAKKQSAMRKGKKQSNFTLVSDGKKRRQRKPADCWNGFITAVWALW